MKNLEFTANELVKVQTITEKSFKDKIIETVATEVKAKARIQVYDDLSAHTPLALDKRGRLTKRYNYRRF